MATILTIIVIACKAALYMPTTNDAQSSGVSVDSLILGRNLYIDKCSDCHNLHKPESYSQKEWLDVMPTMKRKAKTTKEETALITKFLLARCKK